MSEGAAIQVESEVYRAIEAWEPRVAIDDIVLTLEDTTISLTISWRPNGSQLDSTSTIEFRI